MENAWGLVAVSAKGLEYKRARLRLSPSGPTPDGRRRLVGGEEKVGAGLHADE